MESFFVDSYLFEPTQFDDEPSSFLSFSSLAGLAASPTLSSWSITKAKAQDLSHSNPASDYTSSQANPTVSAGRKKQSLPVAMEEKESQEDLLVRDGVTGVSQDEGSL